jgi:16S rRNA (uracil1498-N3)-methyltransferase
MTDRLRRLHVATGCLIPGPVPLAEAEQHYVRRVLRLSAGAQVALFDGAGVSGTGHLAEAADGTLHVEVEAVSRDAEGGALTVAAAVPKGERADWLVEKLTELGVHTIAWLVCARSVVLLKDPGAKMARWQRLAEAAARQAGRATLPCLEAPVPFATFVAQAHPGARLIAQPGGGTAPACRGAGVVLIGPEGGFTGEELQQAAAEGYTAIALSRHVLRVETAAIAAAAQLLGGG